MAITLQSVEVYRDARHERAYFERDVTLWKGLYFAHFTQKHLKGLHSGTLLCERVYISDILLGERVTFTCMYILLRLLKGFEAFVLSIPVWFGLE